MLATGEGELVIFSNITFYKISHYQKYISLYNWGIVSKYLKLQLGTTTIF